MKTTNEILNFCKENGIQFLDFKVSDLNGRWHHLSIPVERFNDRTLEEGIGFDGSSYGYLRVEKSDMVFIPDLSTAKVDKFHEFPTLSMIGNIYSPGVKMERFSGDPRYIAEKAQKYMVDQKIADRYMVGPEFEFHVFDSFYCDKTNNGYAYSFESLERGWPAYGVSGYKLQPQRGYHADIPHDTTNDFRSHAALLMEESGIKVKYHHHEVGASGQVELEVELDEMLKMADNVLQTKYILRNLAVEEGKSVTLMPKPLTTEAGNGLHVHMLLEKDGVNLFYDKDGYAGLSQDALYFIGGLLKHGPALLAFTNPSTNSFKRLVPGFEAPVSLVFALSNRSAVIRIPGYANKPDNKRFEFRTSDATCNPYLCFAALLMAGLDGIQNKIDPVKEGFGPLDRNISDLPVEEQNKFKQLPTSLLEALDALKEDNEFLLKGDVFTKELIENWIKVKTAEALRVNRTPNPEEFELYYDL